MIHVGECSLSCLVNTMAVRDIHLAGVLSAAAEILGLRLSDERDAWRNKPFCQVVGDHTPPACSLTISNNTLVDHRHLGVRCLLPYSSVLLFRCSHQLPRWKLTWTLNTTGLYRKTVFEDAILRVLVSKRECTLKSFVQVFHKLLSQ